MQTGDSDAAHPSLMLEDRSVTLEWFSNFSHALWEYWEWRCVHDKSYSRLGGQPWHGGPGGQQKKIAPVAAISCEVEPFDLAACLFKTLRTRLPIQPLLKTWQPH